MAAQLSPVLRQPATFTIERRTLLRLRREVPSGLRSRLVEQAIREKLGKRGGLAERYRKSKEESNGDV